ncbi:hypothetical protein DI005_09830 [Prauserella sp. PE36]|uniref:Uncharacterized protein n=1 Tax=Prauserella endophytica TaxID=1592324 RepID=A0ABY2SBP7_9PSEU|nr:MULTISPECIES: hypothetical protein [Prauserella]PXY29211.1 hypothetical protein BAY59_16495 [Prauserella coralliicola]RBM21561.1 hypothetical protein DI005_09830 [Prauserella sp. PE36]TKG72901.1 hypothetical protein FCN18_06700 [Prauserella endophytica]
MELQRDLVTRPAFPDYRGVFGWPVRWEATGPHLVIGSGIGAVAMPKAQSEAVLAGLARQDCLGPVLAIPTKREMMSVLLVEAELPAWGDAPPPEQVRVLPAGTTVPLPDWRRPEIHARWIVEPDAHRRWLPSLGAVLATIRSSTPGALFRTLVPGGAR